MSDANKAFIKGASNAAKEFDAQMERAEDSLSLAEILVSQGCSLSAIRHVHSAKKLLSDVLLIEDERRCRRIEEEAALRM
jgi:hypothetical protein